MNAPNIDMRAHYTVDGHHGVAFYLVRYAHKDQQVWPEYEEPEEDRDNIWAIMVGDDREHKVPVEDLTLIAEDDYCGACGQVGCTHDGR